MSVSLAHADEKALSQQPGEAVNSYFEPEYGSAKPPKGYVDLCARAPEFCQPAVAKAERFQISPESWKLLTSINQSVNRRITAITDVELYGKDEYWTYPSTAGDCEDFVLYKRARLKEAGFPASTLLITVVLDEHGEGHAILTVATNEGDFVLDNRRDEVLLWSQSGYQFLKRQSAHDLNAWISLKTSTQQPAAFASSDNPK